MRVSNYLKAKLKLAELAKPGSQVVDVSSDSELSFAPMERESSRSFKVSVQDGFSSSISGALSSAGSAGPDDETISFLQQRLGPFAFGTLYSAVLNITAVIGAGILSLPHAMAALKWAPGIIFLLLSLAVTYFSLWQLVEMHEEKKVDQNGVPQIVTYNRYQDLARRAWGRTGMNLVATMQLVVFVGVSIVYMVAGGLSLLNVYKLLVCPHGECDAQIPALWIFLFSTAQYPLSQRRGLRALFYLSLLAAVMSLGYSGIIFGATIAARGATLPPPTPPAPPSAPAATPTPELKPGPDTVWAGFSALGAIAFAYAGHNVVLDIQSSIPTTESMKSSKGCMMWGITIAYLVAGVCYLAVATSGYVAFGDAAAANVLGTFAYGPCSQASLAETNYKGWTVAANIMVAVHLTGTYQIFAMPVYLQVERVLKENFKIFSLWSNSAGKVSYTFAVRWSYILFTFIMAILLPDFNNLLGILGGFAFAPTTYFLPCLLWIYIFESRRWGWMWIVNWGVVVFGALLMILSIIGSFVAFINNVSHYEGYWAFDKGCRKDTYITLS